MPAVRVNGQRFIVRWKKEWNEIVKELGDSHRAMGKVDWDRAFASPLAAMLPKFLTPYMIQRRYSMLLQYRQEGFREKVLARNRVYYQNRTERINGHVLLENRLKRSEMAGITVDGTNFLEKDKTAKKGLLSRLGLTEADMAPTNPTELPAKPEAPIAQVTPVAEISK
jgi:hypothetical protein